MRWSYKTVHYELKKDGLLGSAFLDESEVEVSLNEYGKAGWELVSMLETSDGIIAVFKQPLTIGRADRDSFRADTAPPVAKISSQMARKKETPDIDHGVLDEEYLLNNEEIEEAVLLSENIVETADTKKTAKPVTKADVGAIRIE
jgi:hypothetical protein